MGRVREFDAGEALAAAMRVFWRQGYEATTVADLVEATGVAKASLYATFGDKHALYRAALESYAAGRDPGIVERLAGPGPALPAIKELLSSYAAGPFDLGCFVVNAAVERLPGDDAVALTVEASWETVETALQGALARARAGGELRAEADPVRLARFLLVVLQGLRVVAKGRPGSGRGDAAVSEAGALLDFWTVRS